MGKNKSRDKDRRNGTAAAAAPAPNPLAGQSRFLDPVVRGDFRAARAEAKKALADPAASEAEKAAAREVISRLSIDRGALTVGLIGATALAVIATLVLR